MTIAGWIIMVLACVGITGLMLWCIRKVVVTPEAPEHLHAPLDVDTRDKE
jgi:hypothetical protein